MCQMVSERCQIVSARCQKMPKVSQEGLGWCPMLSERWDIVLGSCIEGDKWCHESMSRFQDGVRMCQVELK